MEKSAPPPHYHGCMSDTQRSDPRNQLTDGLHNIDHRGTCSLTSFSANKSLLGMFMNMNIVDYKWMLFWVLLYDCGDVQLGVNIAFY